MATRAKPHDNGDHLGVINAGEVYLLEEAARRLHWGRKTKTKAKHEGLRTVKYGRIEYVTGEAVLTFFRGLESRKE